MGIKPLYKAEEKKIKNALFCNFRQLFRFIKKDGLLFFGLAIMAGLGKLGIDYIVSISTVIDRFINVFYTHCLWVGALAFLVFRYLKPAVDKDKMPQISLKILMIAIFLTLYNTVFLFLIVLIKVSPIYLWLFINLELLLAANGLYFLFREEDSFSIGNIIGSLFDHLVFSLKYIGFFLLIQLGILALLTVVFRSFFSPEKAEVILPGFIAFAYLVLGLIPVIFLEERRLEQLDGNVDGA